MTAPSQLRTSNLPSGGCPPAKVKRTQSTTSVQKNTRNAGLYRAERTKLVSSHGTRNRTKIDPNIAKTPRSLFGIARRMA